MQTFAARVVRREEYDGSFCQALTSAEKSPALPEEFDYFGKLIGSWKIDYIDNGSALERKGEWHFSRVLEGMGVQDVIASTLRQGGRIVLPNLENPRRNGFSEKSKKLFSLAEYHRVR